MTDYTNLGKFTAAEIEKLEQDGQLCNQGRRTF